MRHNPLKDVIHGSTGMKKKILTFLSGIGLSLLSTVVILLVLEGVVRLTTDFKFRPKARTHLPISSTYRLSENPGLVYELLPGSRARVQGIPFRINAVGFRDRPFHRKKPGRFRIIVVGDSLTYGWGVALKNTFHKQLESRLRGSGCAVEVLAMGVVGYNTVQEFHLIKAHALGFQPDLVVLQMTPNDFERTAGIQRSRSGKGFTLTLFHDLRIPYVTGKTGLTKWLMRHSYLFRFISLRLGALRKQGNPAYSPKNVFLLGEEKSFRFLARIASLLADHQVPMAAVIFPEASRGRAYRFKALHEKIHRALEQMSVPFVDLSDALNGDAAADVWLERIHPNVRGHAIAAERLFELVHPLVR